MQIGSGKAVSIAYTLKDDDGKVLDTSEGRPPLTYLHGRGAIVPGLEKVLEGKGAGEKLEVTLPPEDAYGARDEALVCNIPVRRFKLEPGTRLAVGQRYRAWMRDGLRVALVKGLAGDYASVDANHPLAGMRLHFQVEVVDVRDATAEELAHGHVHGPGGHH